MAASLPNTVNGTSRHPATFPETRGLYSELPMFLRFSIAALVLTAIAMSATLGTVVPVLGGAADIVLDEARGRVYLVNTIKNQVEIYAIQQRRLLNAVRTDGTPIAAAISRSGKYLYVTSQDQASIDTLDLDTLNIVKKIALPAKPEGIAVGGDERVLVTTIGSGAGNAQNVLLIYDPSVDDPAAALSAVPMAPPPPQSPQLPPVTGKVAQTSRGNLAASADGKFIVGANVPAANLRVVFVYEVSSGTVLRSRLVANSSGVLAVAPDGSKFMSGSTLFDATTLQVLAQENLANAPYMVQPGTQFNIETNQGGSAFSPDSSVLYAGFDIAPQTNPPTRANVSQLMLNDPDNLLIQTAFQLPENLSGKMVISSDGNSIYALSESGMMLVPVGTAFQNAVATVDSNVVVLKNDQCGVTAPQNTSRVTVSNIGRGRMTATAQVLQLTPVGPAGLGGGGAGGGIIGGGGVVIILPPVIIGGGGGGPGPVIPGGPATGTASNAAIFQTAPPVAIRQNGAGATLDFSFNATAARALGTISPSHDFVVQSPEAVNIPPRVRVYQNNRNAEAIGDIVAIPVGTSANEALEDMIYDAARQRLYISNSGMNRVEVFDIRQKKLLSPVKVGQLPHAMALSPDGGTLYVGNTGGETISIVDLDKMQAVGRVRFPPLPLFANLPLATPTNMASSLSGPLFIMNSSNATGTVNNGSIWQVVGDAAVPRRASAVIGATNGVPKQIPGPRSMASTPGGEFVVLAGADGFTYLYDALADDFVQARQLITFNQSQGYFGPVTAGPRGQYYVVNGNILNQALTPINGTTTGGGTTTRPIAAVAAATNTMYARLTQPIRANANQLPSDAGLIELIDANSGATMRTVPALEGPISQATANGRPTAVEARTMAIDSSGSTAYVLTTSGLSIIPLDLPNPADWPVVNPRGAVNLASYQTSVAPNGLLSIFGRNMAASDAATSAPLPTTLGGVCVTLNSTALPLFMTSAGQINAQIPPDLATGNYSLSVRAIGKNVASAAQQVAVSKYAPAVFADTATSQALIVHADGRLVTKDHPAKRDEPLLLFASGLGPTKGGKVTAGNPSPSSPLATTDPVELFFGDPRFSQAGIIVDWSGLAPGFIGLYQLNIRVPGNHLKGDALLVTLKIGGVTSPSTGPLVPTVAVE